MGEEFSGLIQSLLKLKLQGKYCILCVLAEWRLMLQCHLLEGMQFLVWLMAECVACFAFAVDATLCCEFYIIV